MQPYHFVNGLRDVLKNQTGHITDDMIDHYAGHQTDGDRELIQVAKRETFAGLLPDQSNVGVFKIAADFEPQTSSQISRHLPDCS